MLSQYTSYWGKIERELQKYAMNMDEVNYKVCRLPEDIQTD
jgi:hypothetical protein